ncbi:cupin-like domain-containing protein [Scenedesmus sp. NREL 46B-D3]|nr:cupin-like domain-containing protein [Scenedesmus sp. NREL 46B-D3]
MPLNTCSADATECQAVFQQAESSAYPAVFRGLNRSWPALQQWAGLQGLQHLQATAGDATVQAMYARSSEFFGDIQHHTSVECSFRQLLDLAAQQQEQQQQQQQGLPADSTAGGHAGASTSAAGAAASGREACCPNLYLAQQSLQEPGLSSLLEDVPVPELLLNKQLMSINMWFSSRCSRSSLHYDPYQNLLCVVTGCKRVRIYPPAATLGLYPRALGGEASNHSSINFARPDFEQHPLYRCA